MNYEDSIKYGISQDEFASMVAGEKYIPPHVDNIYQFREYIRTRLTEPGDFFQILFMQRSKDGHAKTEVVGFKYLYSVEDLDKNIDYIKQKCIARNARCYIKVNKRNDESVSESMLRYV